MTTSNNHTLALSVNELATETYELLGVASDGETLSGDLQARFVNSANLVLKEWQTFGENLWSLTEGTLFLEVGKYKYDLRTYDKVSNEWYETTTTANTSAGAYVIPVTSVANISKGDKIGVIQSDNNLFWTTVTFINSLNVTVKDPITKATTSGAKVRTFNDTFKPISRVVDIRREENDYEVQIKQKTRSEFFALPNKDTTGTPVQVYYDRQDRAGEKYGVFMVWNSPSSSVPVINFTYERKLEILTLSTQTIDLPDYAQEAFIYNVAKRLCLKVGTSQERIALIYAEADRLLDDLLAFDQDDAPIRIKLGQF